MILFLCSSVLLDLTTATIGEGATVSAFQEGKKRGYLGVKGRSVNMNDRKKMGLAQGGCVLTNVTAGAPADKAGLKVNDIIIIFNAKPVTGYRELSNFAAGAGAGAEVTLTIIRDKAQQKIKLTLGSYPEAARKRWGQWGQWSRRRRGGGSAEMKMPIPGMVGRWNVWNMIYRNKPRRYIMFKEIPSVASYAVLMLPEEQEAVDKLLKDVYCC